MNIRRGPPRSLALCLTLRGTQELLLVHEGASCCLGACSLGRPLRTCQTAHLRVSVCLSFVISPPAKNTCNLLFLPPWVQKARILKADQRLERLWQPTTEECHLWIVLPISQPEQVSRAKAEAES